MLIVNYYNLTPVEVMASDFIDASRKIRLKRKENYGHLNVFCTLYFTVHIYN
ncbi:hypothetical protein HY643_01155 [Candidatus Woesearchaeota archaeon]|nr:hypothetical protein [Candidatus Woesearchaeota archaeon]